MLASSHHYMHPIMPSNACTADLAAQVPKRRIMVCCTAGRHHANLVAWQEM